MSHRALSTSSAPIVLQPDKLLSKPSTVHSTESHWIALLQLWSFLCAGGLLAVTYRLWLPPGWSSFPQIPATALLVNAPAWFDYIAIVGLVVSLILAMLKLLPFARLCSNGKNITRFQQCLLGSILVFGIALVLLNQHRLQAWFYQLLIYCLVFLLTGSNQQLLWLRRIVLSIYVYSALGKLDFDFAHTTGQELLGAAFRALRLRINDWSEVDRITLALGLPLIELLLGIALGWVLVKPRGIRGLGSCETGSGGCVLRAVPGVLACLFHLLLSGLLLWQLQHSWSVVLWNLQFAVQAILLFVLSPIRGLSNEDLSEASNPSRRAFNSVIVFLLLSTMVMPIVERFGYWDHWPSWALYAPHSSRVAVSIAPYAAQHLPDELRKIMDEPSADDSELQIPLGQWSLGSVGVPVYPQARFQLGVARYLADIMESRYAVSGELLSAANRFTGERQAQILRGVDQLQQAGEIFWLNSQPRQPTNLDLPAHFSATTD